MTAFFADCEHELHEVSGGNRIVLVYNLVRGDGGDSCVELERLDSALDEVKKAADARERKAGPENLFIF